MIQNERLYGSKLSPSKPLGGEEAHGMSTGGAATNRLSVGAAMHQTPKLTRKQISVRLMELYQLVFLSLTINRSL